MILGLDYGKVNVGYAISAGKFVLKKGTFKNKNLIFLIKNLIEKEKIKEIVFGLPLSEDNSLNKQCEIVIDFAKKLEYETKIEIKFIDEYLSSFEAEELMKDLGKKRLKESVDAYSAGLILTSYIEGREKVFTLRSIEK